MEHETDDVQNDQPADDDEVIEITTSKPAGKQLTFRIGGELYEFKRPKVHPLMTAIKRIQANSGRSDQIAAGVNVFDEVEQWMFRLLAEEDAARLRARLEDPDDEIDVEHVTQIFQKLVEKAGGRPSTSPSG